MDARYRLKINGGGGRPLWIAINPERRRGYFWTSEDDRAHVFAQRADAELVRRFLPCECELEAAP